MIEAKPRWEVRLTRQAEKTLYRLSKPLLRRLDRALLDLAENPRPAESHPLAGYDKLYRLPVEVWRITYALEEEHLIVLVLEIAPQQQPERYRLEEESDEDFLPERSQPDQTVDPAITFLGLQHLREFGAKFGTVEDFIRPRGFSLLKRIERKKIRLFIVDGLPETRENLGKLLSVESDIEVVGTAKNGEEAVQMAVERQPDMVLMDTNLPGMDGFAACEQISQLLPSIQVIMMSVHGEADYMRRAMMTGAREFLIKPFSRDELMTSVRRVYHSAVAPPSREAFNELKQHILNKLVTLLEPTIDVLTPEQVQRVIQDKYERILSQENIILSRSERERLFADILAEIPGLADLSQRTEQERIRLLIVADNSETLETVRQFLLPEPDMEIVGVVTNIEAATQMTQELLPDIVFTDVSIAGINFLQDPTTTMAIVSVQDGTAYPEPSAMVGSRELLEKPFSKDELVNSIRRVYQSTRIGRASLRVYQTALKMSQLNQGAEGEETEIDETQKKTLAQWFKFYKLGSKIEISLSVADLPKSLSFYHKLGLEKVDDGENPYPWAVVSDGRFYLGLHQQEFSSPTLSYFGLGILSERMVHLPKLGVRLDNIQKLEPVQGMQNSELLYRVKFITAEFASPEGQRVLLADLSSNVETTPSSRKFYTQYDGSTELSLPIQDLNTALVYWEQLGFECVTEGDQPYPWTIISDGLIRLGLHQTPKLTQPTITYFAPDMPERLKRMLRRGITFVAERKDKKGRRVGAVVESPDGQRFFFFTGEIQPPKPQIFETNGSFQVGQRVRIVEGPFADFMGTVEEVDRERSRITVQVAFFGQEKSLEFDFSELERA